jgi:parallel beta-helix repeat protein
MKTQSRWGALMCAFLLCALGESIFAQGNLTPPGAPGPTMKTLDQVEARTPIPGGTTLFTISASGSYYLTGNVNISLDVNGITIAANNVTIDLNGFTLTGPSSGSGSGIYLNGGVSNVTISNGTIRNWGSHGINGLGNSKLRAEKLRVISNGGIGIAADVNAEVVNCVAESNVATGIQGTDNCLIKDCQVTGTTGSPGHGIFLGAAAVVTGCVSNGNSGFGIRTGNSCTVTASNCVSNSGNGIYTGDSCTVTASTSVSNSNGFNIQNQCTIIGCTAVSNSGVGIYPANNCTIKDCTASQNGTGTTGSGISAGNGCTFSNCTASSNFGCGIRTDSKSTITGCTVSGNTGDGIQFTSYCLISGNNSSGNGIGGTGHGFHNTAGGGFAIAANRIDGNHANFNTGDGFLPNCTDRVVRNMANGNGGVEYGGCSGGPYIGPVGDAYSTYPWGNF